MQHRASAILSIICLLLQSQGTVACKARKSVLEEARGSGDGQQFFEQVHGGALAMRGVLQGNTLQLASVTAAKAVAGRELRITDIKVQMAPFQDSPNEYPLVQVSKDDGAMFVEYKLCQGNTCVSDSSTKEEFSILKTTGFMVGQPLLLEVRACVEATQSTTPENCGAWFLHNKFTYEPLVIRQTPDVELGKRLAAIQVLEGQIRANGPKMVATIQDTNNAAGSDDHRTSLASLGGHLVGSAMLADAKSSVRPSESAGLGLTSDVADALCFTREDYNKLGDGERCKVDQLIGSRTEVAVAGTAKYYWDDDTLCRDVVACYDFIGCAPALDINAYLAVTGEGCVSKGERIGLQVGGGASLIGGVTVALFGMGVALDGGSKVRTGAGVLATAVGVAAVAVGIWLLLKSEGYALATDADDTNKAINKFDAENRQLAQSIQKLARDIKMLSKSAQ